MSQYGDDLQNSNQEFVKCLQDLKKRRSDLQKMIESEEAEKCRLQQEIEKMSSKLTRINDSLAKKISVRNEYDRTISESEAAYIKILESSQLLLNMLKRENSAIEQILKSDGEKHQYRQ